MHLNSSLNIPMCNLTVTLMTHQQN